MRIIERITLEARQDNVWHPYPTEAFCWKDWDTDSEVWAFCLLAPLVTLWYYLEDADWARRRFNGKRPPEHLRDTFLSAAIKSERDMDEARLEAVRSYVRNLPPEA